MKRIILSAAFLLPLAVMAQDGYTLKGKVGALKTPAKAYLQYISGNERVLDSAVLNNGVFEFKGTVNGPTSAQLVLKHETDVVATAKRNAPDAIGIFLENKTITLTSADSLKKATIKGSPLNDDNAQLKIVLKPVFDKMAALNTEYASKTPEVQQDPVYRKTLEKRAEVIEKDMKLLSQKFIDTHRDSYVALVAFRNSIGYEVNAIEAEPEFNKFSATLKATPLGQKINDVINSAKKTGIGSMAADFTQNDVNGKPVKLSDFKGKYVLVDFWASWCGPCRAENPNVVMAYNKFKDKNFTILGVSLDRPDGKEAWIKAVKDDSLAWTNVSDLKYFDNEVAKLYGIQSIPANVLVDPNGKIVAKNIRGEALQAKLAELLGSGAVK